MSFNFKWFILDIHWISTGEKSNPKPNPIPNSKLKLKTVGEKSFPNSNPQNLKPAGIRPNPIRCHLCQGPRLPLPLFTHVARGGLLRFPAALVPVAQPEIAELSTVSASNWLLRSILDAGPRHGTNSPGAADPARGFRGRCSVRVRLGGMPALVELSARQSPARARAVFSRSLSLSVLFRRSIIHT
jgi:hypothetical protein